MPTYTTETGNEPVGGAAPMRPVLRLLHTGLTEVMEYPAQPLCVGVNRVGREGDPPAPRSRRAGRRPDGESCLSLPEERRLSRRHAEIILGESDDILVRDCGSKNGTFVNGARVGERSLSDGDVIRFGDTITLLRFEPSARRDEPVPSWIGVSPAADEVRRLIALAAPSRATVLLLGATGTGKEVAAQALHHLSRRAGPLIAVNCGAIPEQLAESQLFGHVAGAFTGAASAQPGYFRAAQGGTLFLDEIGELPPALQPKLLRALEERRVVPVGATASVPCDVRVIAATHRDLGRAILEQAFRGDLYARLAEVVIAIPPLSARREDVVPLLAHALGEPRPRLTPKLVEALLLHPWPFNVRELFKVAAQLRLYAADPTLLDVDAIADRLQAPREPAEELRPDDGAAPARSKAISREELVALLEAHHGNISHVARVAGRSRRQLQRWMDQHALDPAAFRKPAAVL